MLKDLKEKIKKYLLWIMLIIVVLIGIIATTCIFYFSKDCNQAGTIGDTLSGVFTSLAFICAIFALALQSNELSLQREELKQTRTELKNQKKEFQIQNQTLKRQQFENTFFNMLKTQENIVSNLETGIEGESNYRSGRRVFVTLYNWLQERIQKKQHIFYKKGTELKKEIVESYSSVDSLKMLDHYFRHMYRIVKFIDETDFSFCLNENDKNKNEEENNKKIEKEKYEYTSILRATLSHFELALFFYNCLNKENKFRPLIKKYCLLQNIRTEYISKNVFDLYDNESYGNRYENMRKELEKRDI